MKTAPNQRVTVFLRACLIALAVIGGDAQGADFNWINAGGGNFSNPFNWLNVGGGGFGPPAANDTATFGLSNDIPVTISDDRTVNGLNVQSGTVRLNPTSNRLVSVIGPTRLTGGNLVLHSFVNIAAMPPISDTMDVATSTLEISGNGTLTVEPSSELINSGGLFVGTGSAGSLVVQGAITPLGNGRLSVPFTGQSFIGHNGGIGTLTVNLFSSASFDAASSLFVGAGTQFSNRGTLNVHGNTTLGDLFVGSGGRSGQAGSVFVDSPAFGQGLDMLGDATLTVGANLSSTGNVTITSGQLQTGTGLSRINKTGVIQLMGTSSTPATMNIRGDLTIDGGRLAVNFTDSINHAPDTTVRVQNGGRLEVDHYDLPTNSSVQISGTGSIIAATGLGKIDLHSGTQVSITNGGTLQARSIFTGDNELGASVIVDGVGSLVTHGGGESVSRFGIGSGTGSLLVRNGANAVFHAIDIGSGTGAEGSATIESGSQATAALWQIGGNAGGSTGTMTVRGPASIANGTFRVDVGNSSGSSASLEISDGASLIGPNNPANPIRVFNNGTVELSNGSLTANRVQLLSGANGGGRLQGNGTIVGTVENNGQIVPGTSAGRLDIQGDYSQLTGVLEIDIAGTGPLAFDVLSITGQAQLGGSLVLDLAAGFLPAATDLYPVVQAGSISGAFANAANGSRLRLPELKAASFRVNYGAGSLFSNNQVVLSDFELLKGDFNADNNFNCLDVDALVAEIVAGTNGASFDLNADGLVNAVDLPIWLANAGAVNLPSGHAYLRGDANLDGFVDGTDFTIWNQHKFTLNAAWCRGDFTADGIVDGLDFNAWNANKFQSADGVSAVPEPSAAWLAMIVLISPWMRWNRLSSGECY